MATKSDITKAAVETDKFLAAKQKLHVTMVQNSIKTLQKDIINSLNILKTTDAGKLQGLKVNMVMAQKLQTKIENLFYKDFNSHTKKIIKDFKSVPGAITSNFGALGEAAKFTNVDETMMSVLRDGYYQDYLNLGGKYKNQVVQSIYNNVLGGGSFSNLVNTINGALVGTAAKGITGAALSQYSTLYARDMIMNFHNEVNLKKAEDLNMDTFIYTGTIMSTTRPFCRRRVGNPYTKKEIDSWKNKWKGKSGPAYTHRGGYNCRHHWQPVRKEWLDEKEMSMFNKLHSLNKEGKIIPKKVIPKKVIPKKVIPKKVIPKKVTPIKHSPSMTVHSANKWAAQGNNTKTFYQGTTSFVSKDAIKLGLDSRVKKLSGIDFGEGVFLSEKKIANKIAIKIPNKNGRVLAAKVNVKKLKVINSEKEWSDLEALAWGDDFSFKKSNKNIAAYLKKQGYDGIDLRKFSKNDGGILIFDKTKTTFIKGTNSLPTALKEVEKIAVKKIIQEKLVGNSVSDIVRAAEKVKFKEMALDAVGKNFRNAANGKLYMKRKQVYAEFFKKSGIKFDRNAMKTYYKNKMPKTFEMMQRWQGSTNELSPMAFRYQYTKLEKSGNVKKLVWKESNYLATVKEMAKKLVPINEYIEIRAINQAYMEAKKMEKITLMRGTDGRTGAKIANEIKKEAGVKRNAFPIDDRQLAGYTTSKKTASKFGKGSGGITIRQKFRIDEILIHPELMSKLTGQYINEIEYIVKSQRRNVTIKDMWWNNKEFGEGI